MVVCVIETNTCVGEIELRSGDGRVVGLREE